MRRELPAKGQTWVMETEDGPDALVYILGEVPGESLEPSFLVQIGWTEEDMLKNPVRKVMRESLILERCYMT